MCNISLTQKYRPQKFEDVLDQEDIVTVLKSLIKNKKYSDPLMFSGTHAVGKTTLARIFAKAVLCENLTSDIEPCGKCQSCLNFEIGKHLAYTEMDAASNSGVDDIRKLKEDAYSNILGNFKQKVLTIDECHSISKQGNEALLKQLEENKSNQVYLFCTTSPESMLDTVRSRCFEFILNKISKESIKKRLTFICDKEKIAYQIEALEIIALYSAPHVRDAIKTLDYLSNFGEITKELALKHYNYSLKMNYLEALISLKTDVFKTISILKKTLEKVSISSVYEGLSESILNTIKLSYGVDDFFCQEQKDLGITLSSVFDLETLLKILDELLKRNKYADLTTLESDLILINNKITAGFNIVKEKEITFNIVSGEPLAKEGVTGTIQKEIAQKSNTHEESLEKPLEETTTALQRYKSYPPQLAVLMSKSKNNNTIIQNSSVELKKEVKEYSQTISKTDLKNFINSKR